MGEEEDASRAGVGLIVPPVEVRVIVDTTAAAVSRKPALEGLLKVRKASEPKFSFLFERDPYHQYYLSKIVAPSGSTGSENASVSTPKSNDIVKEKPKLADEAVTTTAAPVVSKLKAARARKDAARRTPNEPPPEDVFTVNTGNFAPSALVLDVMKLTAQFVAQYGAEFQTQVQNKEVRNPVFYFMKPTHPFFSTFQRLVDAYSVILRPPGGAEELIKKLRKDAATREPLMERVWYLHDWELQRNERAQAAAESAEERMHAAQIDWQDFTPLETIDLDDLEKALPAPIADARQLPRVLAAAEKARLELEKNRSGVDMDVDMEIDEGENVVVANVHADIPADRVRKAPAGSGGVPEVRPGSHTQRPHKEPVVQLPSGQVVPASQAEAAVQAELFDPAFKEERARAMNRNRQQNLASDAEMVRSLARLSRARNEAEVYNRGDLQSGLAARPRTSAAEADAALARPVPTGPQLPGAKRVASTALSTTENALETPEKRARIAAAKDALAARPRRAEPEPEEDELLMPVAEPVATPAGLMPEAEWLEKVGDSVQVIIKVPKHGNANWDLQGQEIEMKAPLKSTVGKLKKKLNGVIKVPVNKQKLQCAKGGFMKDKMTLAFYNIGDRSVIQLELKERGGKKKKD